MLGVPRARQCLPWASGRGRLFWGLKVGFSRGICAGPGSPSGPSEGVGHTPTFWEWGLHGEVSPGPPHGVEGMSRALLPSLASKWCL